MITINGAIMKDSLKEYIEQYKTNLMYSKSTIEILAKIKNNLRKKIEDIFSGEKKYLVFYNIRLSTDFDLNILITLKNKIYYLILFRMKVLPRILNWRLKY